MKATRIGFKHSEATKAKLREHLINLNKNILADKKGIKVTIIDLVTQVSALLFPERERGI